MEFSLTWAGGTYYIEVELEFPAWNGFRDGDDITVDGLR